MENSQQTHTFEPVLPLRPSENVFRTQDASIDSLNLNRVIAKSMDADSGYGWDYSLAMDLSDMYRAFLFLCKIYPDQVIVPTREVDEFWHLHILDTQNYAIDCQNIFGKYLHHYPYAGLEGTSATEEEEQKYIQNTIELVARHFPNLIGT